MKIAIVGAGAMGGAVAEGLLSANFPAEDLTLSCPHPENLERFVNKGVKVTSDNLECVRGTDIVIVAVKPWILPIVAQELRAVIEPERQEIGVIVAGVSSEDLKEMFNCDLQKQNLSIVMPNTAVAVGESMTFVVDVCGATELANKVFSLLGEAASVKEELLPALTALASCGIAFAMRYVRASEEGGVELGIKAQLARKIVAQTLKGAASLLLAHGEHPEVEIDKVTTPGGITIRGLNVMEKNGFSNAVIEGLKACGR